MLQDWKQYNRKKHYLKKNTIMNKIHVKIHVYKIKGTKQTGIPFFKWQNRNEKKRIP